VGNLVLIDGRCGIVEYSDLPERLARQTERDGALRFRAGNAAIHVFDVEFLKKMCDVRRAKCEVEDGAANVVHRTSHIALPFHLARKKVPYLNERGEIVEPSKENALKFEMFIFDVLPLADRWTVVEIDPKVEFQPLKNATGADSPATVKQAMSNQAGDWLEQAGIKAPRQASGDVAVALEISPLFALEAEELRGKVGPQTEIKGPTYFG
jgi:UDP-N-acetylglucosamine/UDP-N-acetylgalactosamine diphosphorylase